MLRLASVLWRLRRATGIETALFESVTAEPGKVEQGSSRPTLVEAVDLSDRNQLHLIATPQSDAAAGKELSLDTKKDIADGFLRLAALPTFALDRLSRYEHLLWRQARQIVFTLESLRRRKRQPSRSSFPFSFRRRERAQSRYEKDLADSFLRLAALPTFALDRLSRMSICSGGKRDRSSLRLSRCGAASEGQAVQPFHSRSDGAIVATSPKKPHNDNPT